MKTQTEKEYWQRFIQLLLNCPEKKQMDELLHLFLTMNEREYLVSRYRIIEALLTTEQTQRVIASNLNVSITKITDGSKSVQIISDNLREFLTKEMSVKHVKRPNRKIDKTRIAASK